MRASATLILMVALVTTSPLSALSQSRPRSAEGQDENKIVVGTSEVVLDAVVKDKKGQPVRGLTAADFEVFEDGVRQQITSFRFVGRDESTPAAKNSTASNSDNSSQTRPTRRTPLPDSPENRLGAIALVFDRLSPDARARARAAALEYINQSMSAEEYVGVFAVDLSLQVLQVYTNDAALVKRAIEKAGSQSSTPVNSTRSSVRELYALLEGKQFKFAPNPAESFGNFKGEGAAGAGGTDPGSIVLIEMVIRTLETYERMQRDQQGYATTDGLLSLIDSLRRISGRKAVIFFSEGVAIPPAVKKQFASVIGNANLANVSIYAVDAGGLRTDSPVAETRREMLMRGERRLDNLTDDREYRTKPMTRDLELNEDLLTLNPESGLGQLAEQTSGFLISETNAMGAKLRQVDDDLHSHYVMSYLPANKNYDGRFRRIEVKLRRSGLALQTRKGYYALGADFASPVLSHEAPALGVLGSNSPYPASFPLHVGGFNFPSPDKIGRTAVLVEVPAGAVTYAADGEKKNYKTDFTVVALVKDEAQRVVAKLSKQYLLSGPLGAVDSMKRGELLFYRETELPAGRYTVVAAGYDALTGKAGVGSKTFEVQATKEKQLGLSALALLKRAEKTATPATGQPMEGNPFRYGEVLVYPNLGEPLRKATTKQLAFYLVAYTAEGAETAPQLTVELMQQGHSLGQAKLNLPAPDVSGRIQFASALPIEQLKAGDYSLKATVDDGVSRVTRSEPFTLQE